MTAPAYGALLRDFKNDAALRLLPDTSSDILFGLNLDADVATTPEDVWSVGGIYTGHPLNTPELIRIVSTSAADNLAGVGAHAFVLFGLKSATSEFYEFEVVPAHPTDGTIPVTTVEPWFRVTRVFTISVGSAGATQGIITISQDTTTANIFGQIPIDFERTQCAVYTVPFNRTLGVNNGEVSIGRETGPNGHALVSGMVRPPGGTYQAVFTFSMVDGGPIPFVFDYAGPVPAGSDILFRVQSVSDNNTIVAVSMNFALNR